MQVIFKSKQNIPQLAKSIVTNSESESNISNPQRMSDFINLVQATLKKFNISASEFTNLLLNTT